MIDYILTKLGLVAHAALASSTIGTVVDAGATAFVDSVVTLILDLLPYALIIACIMFGFYFFYHRVKQRKL